jgi:putative redox protein
LTEDTHPLPTIEQEPNPMVRGGDHERASDEDDTVLVTETLNGLFQNEAIAPGGRIVIDQPVRAGGMGMGPDPFQVLAAALGACTAQTLRLYINERQWPVHRLRIAVTSSLAPERGRVRFERIIAWEGELSDVQRAELEAAAEKSPVNALLSGGEVVTRFGPIGDPAEQFGEARISHWIMLEQALRAA